MHPQSIWSKTTTMPSFPALDKNTNTDILIIGGGMTGLLCGLFLKDQGQDYILIEQNRIASHTTADTTAKLTTQHGLIYSSLLKYQGKEIAQGYYEANRQALQMYPKIIEELNIQCDLQYRTNLIYDLHSQKAVEEEIRALEEIKGSGIFVQKPENLPVTPKAAVATLHQAQFHPLKFAKAIAVPQQGQLYEHTKALDMKQEGDDYVVTVTNGRENRTIRTKEVIIATHFPFKNLRGLYFLKMHQERSYVLLLDNIEPSKLPPFMAAGSQTGDLSLRTYGDKLIFGGLGGKTGTAYGGYNQLAAKAARLYPHSKVSAMWAAQDCMTLDNMPYIGHHNPSHPDIKVATGFNKWGMTGSMTSALILTGQMDREIANIFYPHRFMAYPQALVNAATSVANLLKPIKPRCTHMGCALRWNREEQSWDCPCHGSRYTKEGKVENEPAQKNLKKPSSI